MADGKPESRKRWKVGVSRSLGGGHKKPASKRGRQLFVVLALMLALGASIVALLFLPRTVPDPYLLTVSIREYKSPQWPTNPFAIQDGNALLPYFLKDNRKTTYSSQTRERIIRELGDLPPDPDVPVIVHLCAQALTRKGEVFVLPGDARPDRQSDWLSLKHVLDLLKKNKSRKKLLLLDIARPLANAQLGILRDDVADGIHALLEKEDLSFLVLTSCSRGQTSLVLEDVQLSIFSFYLERAFAGMADGYGDGKEDQWISAREVADYLTANVDRWAGRNRATRQTPKLFGPRHLDFTVIRFTETELERKANQLQTFPKWLREGWALRDTWKNQDVLWLAPRPVKRLEAVLLAAEQRWRGGREPDRVKADLQVELKKIKEQLQSALDLPSRPSFSAALTLTPMPGSEMKKLAEPAAKDSKDKKKDDKKKQPANPREKFSELIDLLIKGDLKLAPEKELKKSQKALAKFWEETEGAPPAKIMQGIFAILITTPEKKSAEKFHLAFRLLQARKKKLEFAEWVGLERVEKMRRRAVVDYGWPWNHNAAAGFLRATRAAETAVAGLKQTPQALPWVSGQFKAADAKRREGEVILFHEDYRYTDWPKAVTLLAEAEALYNKIPPAIAKIRRAYQTYNLALVDLPGYMPCLVHHAEFHERAKEIWKNAVERMGSLAQLLAKPSTANFAKIDEVELVLNQSDLHDLKIIFDAQIGKIRGRKDKTAADYLRYEALLKCPNLTAAVKANLWSEARALSRRLHEHTLQSESGGAARIELQELRERQAELAARRAWSSLQLLQLAGVKTAKMTELLALAENKNQQQDWAELGGRLRRHWVEQLPEKYMKLRKNWFDAECLACLLAYNKKADDRKENSHWSHNPSAQLNQVRYARYWDWLRIRYRAEDTHLRRLKTKINFFARAANNLDAR